MNILLVSVPHSGTTFFNDLIKPSKVTHLYDDRLFEDIFASDLTVCALRHPRSVYESWWRRSKIGEGSPKGSAGQLIVNWDKAWNGLASLEGLNCIIHYLPIDTVDKQECLDALGEMIGKEFNPDWNEKKNVGVSDREGSPPHINLSYLWRIPIIGRTYPEG